MNTLLIAIILLADTIFYIIVLDVILSWLSLFWLKIRPKFISDLLDPIYLKIKNTIPTTFWPLDLTPIIIIFITIIIKSFVFAFDPNIAQYYSDLTKF